MKKKICLILGICYAVNLLIPPHVKNVISGDTEHDSCVNYAYKDDNVVSGQFVYGVNTEKEGNE